MNAILVLWARLGRDLGPERREALALAAGLDAGEGAAMARFRRWQDAQARLFGRLLLGRGLGLLGHAAGRVAGLETSEFGQPRLSGGPCFSISHAGELAVCALCADGPVGMDVEERRPLDLADYRASLTRAEWDHVRADPDPSGRFLALWTAKESVLKALGTGLSTPLDQVEAGPGWAVAGGRRWRLKALGLDPGYICHLCHSDAEYDVVITPVGLA